MSTKLICRRIIASTLLSQFFIFQNTYALEQIQPNPDTGVYQPVKAVQDSFHADDDLASPSINNHNNHEALPLTNDFWDQGPLSPPTVEVDGSWVAVPRESDADSVVEIALVTEPDLGAHWDFDTVVSNTVSDLSGNGNTGTLVNGVVQSADHPTVNFSNPGSLSFDGIDDYVSIPDSLQINLGTHGERTIALWFKVNDKTISTKKQVIYEEGASLRGLAIYVFNGSLYVGGWNNDPLQSGWTGTFLSTSAISSNTWHHVALTLQGGPAVEPNAFKAYLDGTPFGSGGGSQLWEHSGNIGIGSVNDSILFHDGKRAGSGHSFGGFLDDPHIYNRTLTQAEVLNLAQGNLPDYTAPTGSIVINGNEPYSTSLSLNLTLDAQDSGSGVDTMSFSENGSSWDPPIPFQTQYTYLLSAGEGLRTLYVKFYDQVGNESQVYSDEIMVDTMPPAVAAFSANYGATYTTDRSITISLGVIEETSGPHEMRFSDDAGVTWSLWEPYAETISYLLPEGDGLKEIYVEVKDNAGNVGSELEDIILDAAPPTGSILINNGDASTASPDVTLNLTGSDATSGVDMMRFSTDGAQTWTDWEAFNTTKSLTLPVGEGEKEVQYQLRDHAGLISTFTDTIIIQSNQEPPTGSIQINNGDAYTNAPDVTLSLTGQDATGLDGMRFSTDGGQVWTTWEPFNTTKQLTLPPGEGEKEVQYQLRNQAGLISTFLDTIILDTVPPAVSGLTGPALTNAYEVSFNWSGSDETSGIDFYRWRIRNPDGTFSGWLEIPGSPLSLTGEIALDGSYQLELEAKDRAGLWSETAIHAFFIDRTAPSAVLTSATVTDQAAYTLSYAINDNHDGEQIVTEQITLLQGLNSINRTLTDQAGNSQTVGWTISFLPVTSTQPQAYWASFVPLEWVQTTGLTGITFDDQAQSFTLPFSFRFFGVTYTQIQVSSNGFIQFGSCNGCTDFTPDAIPTSFAPNGIAAPLWRDLNPYRGGSITYLSSATQFVVTWDGVPNYSNGVAQRFQLILKSDGSIIFQYDAVTSGPTTAVGLENATGTQGILYTLLPRNGIAIKFSEISIDGSVSINDGALYTSTREVTLTLEGSSQAAALDAMRFSTDGGQTWTAWEPFNTTKDLTLPVGDGEKQVQYELRDTAGNTATFTDTIILDTTPPEGSILINNGDASAGSPNVILNLTGSDATSGVDQMRFSTDGGQTWTAWEAFDTIKVLSIPGGDGIKEVLCQLKDRAGHDSQIFSDTIVIDTSNPPFLQNQDLRTNEGVRKTMILGPLQDSQGNSITYSFEPSLRLAQNGSFSLLENQLTYIPNDGFTGSGTIAVQGTTLATVHRAAVQLEVRLPQFNVPNDPYFGLQYGLELTRAARAWNLSRGAGVNVAVIDTGIDWGHPDLDANIFDNPGEVPGDGIDNDGNGFIDDVRGWDFYNGDNNPTDDNFHGTHVSGIVAAESNNGQGVSGIAPNAKLIPLKVLDSQGGGFIDDVFQKVANAINYAVGIGAKVINMSLGYWTSAISSSVVQAIQNAITAARQAGTVVVAAAGNENSNAELITPAALEGVVTVAATDSLDRRAGFSNFGDKVEVAAPGVDIWSTMPTYMTADMIYYGISASYDVISGTSMASPHVAGLAALILSQDPSADYDDVVRRLTYSSVDLGAAGFDPYFGWGRIDAFRALTYDYYDGGSIKTQWLEEPDESGFTRLDFDPFGRLIGGTLTAASLTSLSGVGASLADAWAGSSTELDNAVLSVLPSFPKSPAPSTHFASQIERHPFSERIFLVWDALAHRDLDEEEKETEIKTFPWVHKKNRH